MPTLVSIEGDANTTRIVLTRRLLSLGYDLLIDPNYKYTPKRVFYGQLRHAGDPSVHFYTIGQAINMHVDDGSGIVISCVRKGPAIKDFVDFVIWCWGMSRGGRLPYRTKGTVDYNLARQTEWKML